jgi:hypothetical protein
MAAKEKNQFVYRKKRAIMALRHGGIKADFVVKARKKAIKATY